MRYRSRECKLLPSIQEPDGTGSIYFVGHCGCGWESSHYSECEESAQINVLSHISSLECA